MTMQIIETEIFSAFDFNLSSLEILDADWRSELGLTAIWQKREQFEILVGSEGLFTLSVPFHVEYPIIRWIDKRRILVASPRNETEEDNVFILDIAGGLLGSFNAGDGIMDILITKEGAWFSYFDEGIFGEGISTNGLVLFSFTGEPLFKYHSDLKNQPFLTSCDAICEGEGSSVWIFPILLPDVEPSLLHLDFKKNLVNSFSAPELFAESTALSVRGKGAYFHSQFDPKNKLYYWELGMEEPQVAGQMKGILRGLKVNEAYDFIAITEVSIKLIRTIQE
ncbi:TetR family transcriptional regulator [Planomicrobium sp. CPCC 101079]|uniref:TetR family transcriptional regulator n=1 Tax=Planomicrobium sp. CPCC 101079 TaxID=2599618 RepID=UPI0011B4EBBD|nr:TetR family transcriptional regulator [Planomicrobium sp. CPCC 101079]TWT09230.1 TetR family transcriptional regulator [Planomicrobium sp. CPCC 101079]